MNDEIKQVDGIKQAEALTDDEMRLLFGWGENIFGVLPHTMTWRSKDLHFVLYDDQKPVSHVGVLKHEISVGGDSVTVGGIGGVVTVPEAQKKGVAQHLVEHATSFLGRAWAVDAGLLFCLPKMESYYARLGWQTLEAPVTIEQPAGRIISPLPVMILPIRMTRWPTGDVDLQSLPW